MPFILTTSAPQPRPIVSHLLFSAFSFYSRCPLWFSLSSEWVETQIWV